MFEVKFKYKDSLIEILQWNLNAYCKPGFNEEFKKQLTRILDVLYSMKESTQMEKMYFPILKEAVENAMNYVDECNVDKSAVEELFDWVFESNPWQA